VCIILIGKNKGMVSLAPAKDIPYKRCHYKFAKIQIIRKGSGTVGDYPAQPLTTTFLELKILIYRHCIAVQRSIF
jgi:hypothetical protein